MKIRKFTPIFAYSIEEKGTVRVSSYLNLGLLRTFSQCNKTTLMKTVFFIRHAKSSWEDMSLGDKQRPLNPRGKRDAPFMAKMLKGLGAKVDAIITSSANRANTTANFFAVEFGISKEDMIVRDEIYEAYTEDVLRVVRSLDDHFETVLIFGHNPTFTSLANMFSQDYIPNVPTCGIVKVESESTNWAMFKVENSNRTAFYYPKQYL